MRYFEEADYNMKEEEMPALEIDPGLILRKDHQSWLFRLINYIPNNPSEAVHFCISCGRYLMTEEEPTLHRHQPGQGPHHLLPLIRVLSRDYYMGVNYYVNVEALKELQLPIGDVLSHVLPHPPRLGVNGVDHKVRCMYVHPDEVQTKWQGVVHSGRCASRDCERVFPNRYSHLKLYGITPQFCSISCKLKSWIRCSN